MGTAFSVYFNRNCTWPNSRQFFRNVFLSQPKPPPERRKFSESRKTIKIPHLPVPGVPKVEGPLPEPAPSRSPRTRWQALKSGIRGYLVRKKEWVKYNKSYFIGSVAGSLTALGTSSLARLWGVDMAAASTYYATLPQVFVCLTTWNVAWYAFHQKQYGGRIRDWAKKYSGVKDWYLNSGIRDWAKFSTINSLKAIGWQAVTSAITWTISDFVLAPLAEAYHLTTALGVLLLTGFNTQVLDRGIFLVLMNLSARRQVREMEARTTTEKTGPDQTQPPASA